MTTVAIIGSNGQLGTDLVRTFGQSEHDVIPLSHANVEVTNAGSVQESLRTAHPDVAINCAAFVRVDECESHPEEAFRVNAIGAFNVARVCAEVGALCVYVSTDYVFDGDKEEPYTEEDIPLPTNVYGTSKLAGEYLVQQACPRWLIVRLASLFGEAGARGKGGNFVETIVAKARAGEHLKVVNDIRMSPTYARDAAQAIQRLVTLGATGTFHATNSGACTWYEFAKRILERAGLPVQIEPVPSAAYPTPARRPRNSTLSCERLWRVLGIPLRPWQEALDAYLIAKGYLMPRSGVAGTRAGTG